MVWTAAWTDFVICLLFGWLGVHKFRKKKIVMGILYLCTFGLFSVGWFVDTIRYLIAAIKGERITGNSPGRLDFNEASPDAQSNLVILNGEIYYDRDAKTENVNSPVSGRVISQPKQYSAKTYSVCGILLIVLGIVLIFMGLLLLLASPIGGFVAVALGVFSFFRGRQYRKKGDSHMGFLDTFKGNQYKAELENLQKEYDLLKSSLTPEMNDVVSLNREIAHLQDKFAAEQDNMNNLIYTIDDKNRELACLEQDIAEKRKQLVCLDDDIMVQEFGLYTPKFDFAYALDYKEALSRIRDKQKALIKNNMAVTGDTS